MAHRLSDGSTIADWVHDDTRLFRPLEPPPPTEDEVRHAELLVCLGEMAAAVGLMAEEVAAVLVREVPVPLVNVAAPDLSALEAYLQGVAVAPSVAEVADAVATRIVPAPDVTPAFEAIVKELKSLSKKVTALAIMPSGGSSGNVIVDSGIITSITQPVTIAEPVTVDGSFWQATQPVSNDYLANQAGTFNAVASTLTTGVATGVGKCNGIRLFAVTDDASCTVTGVTGTINIRGGTGVDLNPLGTMTAPVVTWVSGTLDVLIVGLT